MSVRLILASESASRRQLLANAGLVAETRPHGVDERALEAAVQKEGGTGKDVALALAAAKAEAVSRAEPEAMVIGADQVLATDTGKLLAKPESRADARRHLERLSGRVHLLHTAFALARDGAILIRQARTARMIMRHLTLPEIDAYLDAVGEAALASVGAYQVEGLGLRLFTGVEGDYFGILGLPMLPLLNALRRFGALDG